MAPENLGQQLTELSQLVDPAQRYVASHRVAEQLALLVITQLPGRVGGCHDIWELLAAKNPELGEWAAFFGYLAPRVAVVAAGEYAIVTEREAADLERDLATFIKIVGHRLARARKAAS